MATSTHTHPVDFAGAPLGRSRHICAFFNSPDEEHRALGSFIKEGFAQRDRAVHLVDPARREAHVQWLAETGVDVEPAIASGQLELRTWEQAQLRGERFDQHAMLALIEELLQSGPAGGYSLTRFVAHMEWACRDVPGTTDLVEFESRVNYVLPKYDDAVICAYDLTKFSSPVMMDILRTHPVVIVGGVLQENPFFIPPDQFLAELQERRDWQRIPSPVAAS